MFFELFGPQAEFVLRLVAAIAAGAAIGYERERHDKPAGLRTNILICFGAALFTLISADVLGSSGDRGRIAAQIVTGIGFLGAGAIIHQRLHVVGMTTAATIWAIASIGMAFGAGAYFIGVVATLLVLFVLGVVSVFEEAWFAHRATYNLEAQAREMQVLLQMQRRLEAGGVRINAWSLSKDDGGPCVSFRVVGPRDALDRIIAELVSEPGILNLRRW